MHSAPKLRKKQAIKTKRISPRLPRRRAGSRRSIGVTAPNERSSACETIPLNQKPLVLPLLRPTPTPAASARTQAQLPSLIPRAAAPAAACVSGRSTGQHMLPQQALKTNGNNAPPQNQKPKPLVLPLPRRHAWLAGPPANTCSRNNPQNKRQQRPPPKTKTSSCRLS